MNLVIPNINGPNSCPACHCALKVKLAAGGNFPGQYYIRCHTHHYHYTFMPGVAPNAVSAPTSHSSTTTSSVKASSKCSESKCHRVANSVCIQLMCKKCCVACTGCGIHTVATVVANKRKGKQPQVSAATSSSSVHHPPPT
ncbi:uncharacterized protein LACBIDRAFT_303244 [Laccaria bicolor S238N-H82]|uniref:Predicted protein n=1 Tax=Laccaria bicolor (strain S238N-H82 / ATCC MYA-4686) TaxID=486041 RepID=B0DJ71_LACBS|nr:uncharacterized protein LACBIDRAFT_303244 [Laccaria bicolor S238N-H82]EDR05468.1 predicted protein [Laccaria bicolor S238N-H82]|eukprot:XP_001884026.1 predicted protein [Laccaria bicolor S238N-H82]